jgi:hypothetical protein
MSQCRGGWPIAILTLVFLSSAHAETPRADGGRRAPADVNAVEPALPVRHLDEENGWFVAESPSFRLYHRQSRQQAVAVLQTAERARAVQQRKWFGTVAAAWIPKCHICFYPSGESYSEATGAPPNPGGGHTDIRAEDGRVFDRCIHLHGPRNLVLSGVLPHEVTHAVLAGHFGGQRVPRWADEGMAILAETKPRIDLHLRQLPRWRNQELLFNCRDLIAMHDYPHPRTIPVFYAQSVSLVDFLFQHKGAKCFTAFIRDGERVGYKEALRRHYGWSFAELDRHWQEHAFGAENRNMTSTGRSE